MEASAFQPAFTTTRDSSFFDSRDRPGLVSKKVTGDRPEVDFDSREVTPIEYIPYKRFEEHLRSQELRAKKIMMLVAVSTVSLVTVVACAIYIAISMAG